MSETRLSLAELLPDAPEGWKTVAEDQVYDGETLFEYIDGGAELYISYGFDRVLSRTYSRPEQPDIIVDLFDMNTSQNAFGVFCHSRETVDETFGQGSQYTEGLLLFWKDRYFISVLASPETPESKQALFDIARHIEQAIAIEGPLPDIVSLLPRESLIEESIRYFHHYIWLNSHYYVADENILNIDQTTEAILAKYGGGGEQHVLLLVRYPGDGKALWSYNNFARHYLPELSDRSVVQIEDGRWTGCQRAGNLLIIVFNAPTEDTATRLMAAVAAQNGEGSKQ